MNNARRKSIAELQTRVEKLKDELNDLLTDIEAVKDEESEAYDNMPEALQSGDKGQAVEAARDALEEAHSAAETAHSSMEEIETALESASA